MTDIISTDTNSVLTSATGSRVQKWLSRLALYITLSFVTLLIVIPLLGMFSTSFKLKSQLFTKEIYWTLVCKQLDRCLHDHGCKTYP